MLKKTLITFFALFFILNLWLWLKPRKMLAQYPKQAHVIKMEEYLYEKSSVPAVLVGSSMAARLESRFLGAHIHNLAVGGATIFEGLEVIRRTNARPRIVLVETNTLFNPRRPEIIRDLFRPGFYQLRHYLPALREKYQPMGLIGRRVFKSVMVPIFEFFYVPKAPKAPPADKAPAAGKEPSARKKPAGKKSPPAKTSAPVKKQTPAKAPATGKGVDPALARPAHIPAKIFNHNLKVYTPAPRDRDAERVIRNLREVLTVLEARGTMVIFLEIPMHCAFERTKLREYSRDILKRNFPPAKYAYWESENCREYGSNDGLHLDAMGGYKFSIFLLTRVGEVLK